MSDRAMNDFELEQRLRSWYRADVAQEVAPDSLFGALSEITSSYPPHTLFRRRAWMLLAAALLLIGAVLAVGVGSGLIRLPWWPDVTPPKWIPAGTTIEPREGHSATLLPNGAVLVLGGSIYDRDPRLTELFDPNNLSWSPTGTLPATTGGTTTLLQDGRVLVAGRGRPQMYDPRAGTWTATGRMIEERGGGHTATLLADGRVLIAGGGPEDVISGSAELYDPTTGTWEVTGSMNDIRAGHTATLLSSGLVLVAGGVSQWSDTAPDAVPFAELYNPANGTWTETGPMVVPRTAHTASLLPNGLVLVAGGFVDGNTGGQILRSSLASTELYDQTTGTWTLTGKMKSARSFHTATTMVDGAVLVTGGVNEDAPYGAASTEGYEPATGQWIAGPAMAQARQSHSATLLQDGSVLIVGGTWDASGDPGNYPRFAEIYEPGTPAD